MPPPAPTARLSMNVLRMTVSTPSAVLAILRQFNGKVLQTNLSSEAEESLRKALGDDGKAV